MTPAAQDVKLEPRERDDDSIGTVIQVSGQNEFTYEIGVRQRIPADVVERRVKVDEDENRYGGLCGARNGEAGRGYCPDSIYLREISDVDHKNLL